MKTEKTGKLILLAIGLLVIGCDKESNNPFSLSGKIVSTSACKNEQKSASVDSDTPDSLSCIDYSFDEAGKKLSLLHTNAGFNCCPKNLFCTVALRNDTITIQEFEKASECDCDCLYDLEIEISGVDTKKYRIKFIEPYVGDQEKIFVEIDLAKDKEGSYCVIRKEYPWGIYSMNQYR
jgi:hypothetical protein